MTISRRPFLKALIKVPLIGSVVLSFMPEATAKAYVLKYPMPPQIPDLPNRTKVVRLIVVPPNIDPDDVAAVQQLAKAEGAAKTDAFIVKDKATGTWHPMSWLGDALIDHEEATRTDRECTVFTMIREREQIQWESSVEFWIESIAKKESVAEVRLINGPAGPDNPFDSLPLRVRGGPGKPLRSGPPTAQYEYKQLYKMTFGMVLEGREIMIDPDGYCDM